jgi:hypothetical protein
MVQLQHATRERVYYQTEGDGDGVYISFPNAGAWR